MRVLSFDVEDGFHLLQRAPSRGHEFERRLAPRIESNIDRILQALSNQGVQATFFCLGWVAAQFPQVLRRIVANGHDVGSHSHLRRPTHELDRKAFAADLHRSCASIANATGQAVYLYRSPGFLRRHHLPWFYDVLAEQGIGADCSVHTALSQPSPGLPVFATPYQVDLGSTRIMEFPASSPKLLSWSAGPSGGNTFGLAPYALMRRHLRTSPYVMAYFRPPQLDTPVPAVAAPSWPQQFMGQMGLHRPWEKFLHLVGEFDFVSVSQAIKLTNWANAPVLEWPNSGPPTSDFATLPPGHYPWPVSQPMGLREPVRPGQAPRRTGTLL